MGLTQHLYQDHPPKAGCVPEVPPALQTGLTEPASMMQERMLAGGSARNRMLVKGGSSFNALVRALKQDVVTGAAPKAIRNEQLMYDVDRVSLVNQLAALETTALQADHLKSSIFLSVPQSMCSSRQDPVMGS